MRTKQKAAKGRDDSDTTTLIWRRSQGSTVPGAPLPDEYASLKLPGYKFLTLLGEGGMGIVFLARQEELDRYVAVKMLAPTAQYGLDSIRRLHAEALTLASLSHPNIVACHDVVRDGERLFVVMDFVPGGINVRDLSRIYGEVSEKHAADIVLQAARGLAYCQSKGVIHRDIKPANLLVFYDSDKRPNSVGELLSHEHARIMIVDFGLAKSTARRGAEATAHGGVAGTPAFVAPEQAEGKEVDHRSDIYGLGATLFRLLTGHDPFEADSAWKAIQLKLSTEFPDVSKHGIRISEDCRRVLRKMTARSPADRYQDYGELIRDLEALADQPGGRRIRRRALRLTRRRVWVAAAAAVLLSCAAVGAFVLRKEASLDLSHSLQHWSGATSGWEVAPADDAVEGQHALVCRSPGERLTLGEPVAAGDDLVFRMRLPGDGQMDVLLVTDETPVWRLRWTREGESSRLQDGPLDRPSEISLAGAKALEDWCDVRLRTAPGQVVLYLDGRLASYTQLEPPVVELALAFELTQGRLMQVNNVRVISPKRSSTRDR